MTNEHDGAHCDFCFAPVPLERKGGRMVYATHYADNDARRAVCKGSGRPHAPSGGVPRRRSWHRRVIDRLRGRP